MHKNSGYSDGFSQIIYQLQDDWKNHVFDAPTRQDFLPLITPEVDDQSIISGTKVFHRQKKNNKHTYRRNNMLQSESKIHKHFFFFLFIEHFFHIKCTQVLRIIFIIICDYFLNYNILSWTNRVITDIFIGPGGFLYYLISFHVIIEKKFNIIVII